MLEPNISLNYCKSTVHPGLRAKFNLDDANKKAKKLNLSVLHAHADNRETIKFVVDSLNEKFRVGKGTDHIVVV